MAEMKNDKWMESERRRKDWQSGLFSMNLTSLLYLPIQY